MWYLDYQTLFLDPDPLSAVTEAESPGGNRAQPQRLGDLSDAEGNS